MTASDFKFEVFFCFAGCDSGAAMEVAQRLRVDGLSVWAVEWPTTSPPITTHAIEQALDQSRTLVLFLSTSAFESQWAQLEPATLRFREDKDRHFVPVLLKKTSLTQTRVSASMSYAIR